MMEAKDGISDNANKQNDELQRVRIHLQSEDGLLVGTLNVPFVSSRTPTNRGSYKQET
jgi:hypothetical protein